MDAFSFPARLLRTGLLFGWGLIPLFAAGQWTWRNPTPQGNDLRVIRIRQTDQSVWAAGSVGTVMHSENEGQSWTIRNLIPRNKFVDFTGLDFPDDSTVVAVETYGYIFRSTDSGTTWDSVYYEEEQYLAASCFSGPSNGYAVGDHGRLVRSFDGGASWSGQYITPPVHLRCIAFPTGSTGYAAGYQHVLKTTDGGATWSSVYYDTLVTFTCLHFSGPLTGILADDAGRVISTSDGGTTWDLHPVCDTVDFWSVGAFSHDTLLLNGREQSTVIPVWAPVKYLSTDGGYSWTRLALPPGSPFTRSVACRSGGTAYAAGYYGSMVKTGNYGNTWESLDQFLAPPTHFGSSVFGIDFPSALTGYAVTGGYEAPAGYILKTTDGGVTWAERDTVFDWQTINAVDFISETIGYIAGSNIYSTWDGGDTWVLRAGPLGWRGARSISFADALVGVAVGDQGLFLRSVDRGQSWMQLTGVPNLDYMAVNFPDSQTGYAAGGSVILKSTDAGATWSQVYGSHPVRSLWFTGPSTGIAVGTSGLILRTADGGTTWDVIDSPTEKNLYAVHFFDADTGYIAGGTEVIDGFILKTTDGGLTWYLQNLPLLCPLYAVRTTGDRVFAGGWNCFLFGTDNGGIPVGHFTNPLPSKPGARVYPNPFSGPATVAFRVLEPSDVTLVLYDARGIAVFRRTWPRQPAGLFTAKISPDGLDAGVYVCHAQAENQKETIKIVRIR